MDERTDRPTIVVATRTACRPRFGARRRIAALEQEVARLEGACACLHLELLALLRSDRDRRLVAAGSATGRNVPVEVVTEYE